MSHYFEHSDDVRWLEPAILLLPANDPEGQDFWLTRWKKERSDCGIVNLGMWEKPHRNTWVNKVILAIHRANRPVILVAHDLGAVALAWWAEYEQPSYGNPVAGALIVGPPDVDRPGRDRRLAQFGACPRRALPFQSILVGSGADPACDLRTAIGLARDWGSVFVDAGTSGHFDAQAGLGSWSLGERLLGSLVDNTGWQPRTVPSRPAPAAGVSVRRSLAATDRPSAQPAF